MSRRAKGGVSGRTPAFFQGPVPWRGLRRGLGECPRDGGAGGRAFAGCGHLQRAVGSDAVRLYALIRDRMLAS